MTTAQFSDTSLHVEKNGIHNAQRCIKLARIKPKNSLISRLSPYDQCSHQLVSSLSMNTVKCKILIIIMIFFRKATNNRCPVVRSGPPRTFAPVLGHKFGCGTTV